MAENTQRSKGRQSEYKFDRGGMPAEMGPYVGIVVNNVDNIRTGRLQVWIEQFGATDVDGSPNLEAYGFAAVSKIVNPQAIINLFSLKFGLSSANQSEKS